MLVLCLVLCVLMLVLCLVSCSDVGLMFWCSLTILKCSWTYVYVWLTMIACCVYSSHGQTTPDICAPGLKSTKAFQPGAAAASKWRSHSRGNVRSSSWRRSQFLGDAHPHGNVRSYSVVSDLLFVLLWITHGSLMISLTLTIWVLWILWSELSYCGGSLCVALWITHGGLMISVNRMIWIFLCSLVTDRPSHAVRVRQPVLLRWCRWWKRISSLGQPATVPSQSPR